MAGKRPRKPRTTQEVAVVPQQAAQVPAVPQKREIILEGDPQAQLEFAHKAASTLMSWVSQKKNPVMIRGEQYLEFGDWQILGRFYGATVAIEWSRPIDGGWEARSVVYRNGEIISAAEAMCMRKEKRWGTADEYAVRSMAQTRASAKALRQAFGWVAELAGMKSTPAEEMPHEGYDRTPIHDDAVPTVHIDDHEAEPVRIPEDVTGQRKVIFNLLKRLGVDITDGQACKTYVADTTQLELVEVNYPEIISQLLKTNGN